MTTYSPLFLLAALGVLSAAGPAAAQVDTSQWKCESCPFPKGTKGNVVAGAAYVSDDSTTFGNYTGLDSQGAYLDLGGTVSYRGDGGYFADLTAADLGLDIRSITAESGRAGLYSIDLGYAEIPRYFAEGARTPFLGTGGDTLTLPQGAGFPAVDTRSMPLATTLQPVELGYKTSRFDIGGKWVGQENWIYSFNLRRDVRDGTKPAAGSFYSNASQLALQVDQTTDQFELAASYATRQFQANVAYQLSEFRNGSDALTWESPFDMGIPGAERGQLAQAPDNRFHQLVASAGYQITPSVRASTDIAYGQGTQNVDYLAPTLNPTLTPSVPAMPASSLDGEVTTFNFNAKITAAPAQGLLLHAIYARDIRDNESPILSYPHVATDLFIDPDLRSNVPFGLTQDRIKLGAAYTGVEAWKFNGGVDWDNRERSYQEVVTTREATVWGRATWQAQEALALTFDLAYGDRNNSSYGVAYWFGDPNNPLMRKYNLASRERRKAAARADWAVSDAVSLGLGVDWVNDDYSQTVIGLNESESTNISADIAVALSDDTHFHAFWQGEEMWSRQSGSQAYAAPDWTGRVEDRFQVLGFGIKHAAIPDKLDLGADLTFSRSDSDTSVQTSIDEPPFPTAETSRDVIKLYANYRLNENLWLNGSYWYERYDSADWRVDGVQPDTVHNLLAFGHQAPQYRVNVFRVSVRYQF